MSKRWSIKIAQAPADSGPADAGTLAEQADQTETGQQFPADFGIKVGTVVILNFMRNRALGMAVDYGMNAAQLTPLVNSVLNVYSANLQVGDFLSIFREGGGNPDRFSPDQGTVQSIYDNLKEVKKYNPADIDRQLQISLMFFPVPAGSLDSGGKGDGNTAWKTIGMQIDRAIKQKVQQAKAQTVTNPLIQQNVPQLSPTASLYNTYNRGRTIHAQIEQSQQGPLATGRYESIDQLRDDLIRLGPVAETYNRFMTLVGPENEDTAKEALSSFYQGMTSGLSSIYDMLVGIGMANPIDKEVIQRLVTQHPNLSPDQQQQEQKKPYVHKKPEDQAMASNEKEIKHAGLFLPPTDSGLSTKTAATSAYPAYTMDGPKDCRMCPKIRDTVSTFICRNHCLDGLIVDDHQVLCGEAIWRQSVMDKFSREYRDKDGNWVGGYLNKRFETHYDDGGHPYLLKPGERSAPLHEDAWSLEKRMSEMRKSQGKARGYNTPKDKADLYNFDQYDLHKGPKNPQVFEKKTDELAKIAVSGSLLEKTAQHDIDDFMAQQQADELQPDASENADKITEIGGKVKHWNSMHEDWEDSDIPRTSGTFEGSETIDGKPYKTVRGDDGEMYAVDPTMFGKPEAPAPQEPEATAPWSTGNPTEAGVFAKKKEKTDWSISGNGEMRTERNYHCPKCDKSTSFNPNCENCGTKTVKTKSVKAESAWGLTKEAWGLDMSSVGGGGDVNQGMGENINHGRVGKKCAACGKIMAGNMKACDNPQCRSMNLVDYNHGEAQRQTGVISNEGLIPLAHSDVDMKFANGVYKATKGGKSSFGETPEEALEKLALDLGHMKQAPIDLESDELLNARQQDMKEIPQQSQNQVQEAPVEQVLPQPVAMDPTPSTKAVPVNDAPFVPEEVGPNAEGKVVSEFSPEANAVLAPNEGHVHAGDLDQHLNQHQMQRHPSDLADIDTQAINSGAHPD